MFQVLDPDTGSDHCPIKIDMELDKMIMSNNKEEQISERPPPIRWNKKTEKIFRDRMNSREMTQLLNEIDNLLENHNADIDEIIDNTIQYNTIQ